MGVYTVDTNLMTIEEAKESGAIALFMKNMAIK